METQQLEVIQDVNINEYATSLTSANEIATINNYNILADTTITGGKVHFKSGMVVSNVTLVNLDNDSFRCDSDVVIDGLTFECKDFGNNVVYPASTSNLTLINGWVTWGTDIDGLNIHQTEGGLSYLMTSGGGTVDNPGKTLNISNFNMSAGSLYMGQANVNGRWDGYTSNNQVNLTDATMSGGTLYFRNGTIENLSTTGGTIILADRGLYVMGEAPVYNFNGDIYLESTTIQRGGTSVDKDGNTIQAANVDIKLTRNTDSFILNNATINTNIIDATGRSTITVTGTGTTIGSNYSVTADTLELNLTNNWYSTGCVIDSFTNYECRDYTITGNLTQGEYLLGSIGAGGIDDLVLVEDFLDKTSYNMQYKMSGAMSEIKTITIHNTANTASAQNERDYLNSRNDNTYVSFHYAVDETQAIHIVPLEYHTWHAGDGRGQGNMNSIAIEICRSTDYSTDRYYQSEANAVLLAAHLITITGLTVDDLRMHQDWSGKYCPHRILDDGSWNSFKDRVSEVLAGVTYELPEFEVNLGGEKFTIALGETIYVDGYTVSMEEHFDANSNSTVAKLNVVATNSTNTELNWTTAWNDSMNYAVKYVNDLAERRETIYLGNTMENHGGNGIINAFGTISTGAIITDDVIYSTIFGGSSTQEVATSWVKVTGGRSNTIYGGGDGQNMTDGTNLDIYDDTDKIFGAGKNSVTSVGENNDYAVNMDVKGGSHEQIHCGADNGSVVGDVYVYILNIEVDSLFTGAGINSSVDGNINLRVYDTTSSASNQWTANLFGGGVTQKDISITGDISFSFTGSRLSGLVFGGSRAEAGANAEIGGDITINMSKVSQTNNPVFGAISSAWLVGAGQAINATLTTNDININLTNSTIGYIVGGAQATGCGSANVEDINITITGGTITNNIFGAGYASDTATSTVNGDILITINSSSATALQGDIYIGGNNVGGQGSLLVDGDATVKFMGNGDNLSFTGLVSGLGKGNSTINGTTSVEFANFTGEFTATIEDIDNIVLSGNTVMNMQNSYQTSCLVFDVSERTTNEAFLDDNSLELVEEGEIKLVINSNTSFEFDLLEVEESNLENTMVTLFDTDNNNLGSCYLLNDSLMVSGYEISFDIDRNNMLSVKSEGKLA